MSDTPRGQAGDAEAPRVAHALKLDAARRRLHVDAVTVEAVRVLHRHRVRAILLKGPAIAKWLYEPGEPRPYVDVDLLVSPGRLDAAVDALGHVGFGRLGDDRVGEAFAEPHSVTLRRPHDLAAVDLHWRLPGLGADPQRAWERLAHGTEEVSVAGVDVEALGEPVRTLHLALHAVQEGREARQPLSDLARGLERLDEATWRAAAGVAAELDGIAPLAAGLRLTPAGAALAESLGLPAAVSTRWLLWGQTPAPGALRLHELAETRGLRAKARYVASALAPAPGYVRGLYPESRAGTRALLLAYLRRVLAGLRNLPGAIRALRRARAHGGGPRRRT